MRKDLLVSFLLLLLSIPAVQSLFIPGGFTAHDLTHHVVRQISMDKLLSEGQFPPRWSGELNNGYGYPVFLFNYPLPAMVGEVFYKLGLGYVDSVKAVLFLSMVISVLGMYLFLNALLKDRLAAFLGAIFYLYAPLRFLTVYVSAAVGSALALGILPFVFWSLVLISKGDNSPSLKLRRTRGDRGNWGTMLGGLSLAGLVLAHNVTALIFAPVLLAFGWVILRLRSGQVGEMRVMRKIGVMFLLGLGLSAWFWIPATFERQYTRFDQVFGAFYKDQFPTLWQLIRSPWGYGLSHPQNPEPGDMAYQIGLMHIGVIGVLGLLMFRGISPSTSLRVEEIRVFGGFALALFALSVFLVLKISLPLWENLPFLALVQFPLRFQAWSVFAASIAAALLVKNLPFKKFLVISLLFLVLYANRNHWNINQVFDPGEDYYLNLKTTSTSYGEHLSKWGRIMEQPALAKLEMIRGMGEIRVIRDKSDEILAEVRTEEGGKLRLNQIYFPGWNIEIDGKKIDFDYLSDPDLIGADGESYGLPIFDIDKGNHLVGAKFKNPPVRNLADIITLITVIIFIIVILNLWKWSIPKKWPVKKSY